MQNGFRLAFALVRVLALSAVVCLAGLTAPASATPDLDDMMGAFAKLVNAWNSPVANKDRAAVIDGMRRILANYLKDNYPREAGDAVDQAFAQNLKQFFGALPDKVLVGMAKDIVSATEGYVTQLKVQQLVFRDFDNVAVVTVASDSIHTAMQPGQLSWSRLPSGSARTVSNSTDFKAWSSWRSRYESYFKARQARLPARPWNALATLARKQNNDESVIRYTMAGLGERERTDALIASFREHFRLDAADLGFDASYLRDFARLQEVTTGWWTRANGQPDRVGSFMLEGLAVSIGSLSGNDANVAMENELYRVLDGMGFRGQRTFGAGLLSQNGFQDVLRLGFMPNDPGAGLEHGRDTHLLQMYALGVDHATSPTAYNHAPVDIIRMLGELNRRIVDRRFGFEGARGLWGEIFDLQYRAGIDDYAHPDGIRAILQSTPELAGLSRAIEHEYATRKAQTDSLRQIWDTHRKNGTNVQDELTFLSNSEVRDIASDEFWMQYSAGQNDIQARDEFERRMENGLFMSWWRDEVRNTAGPTTLPDATGGRYTEPFLYAWRDPSNLSTAPIDLATSAEEPAYRQMLSQVALDHAIERNLAEVAAMPRPAPSPAVDASYKPAADPAQDKLLATSDPAKKDAVDATAAAKKGADADADVDDKAPAKAAAKLAGPPVLPAGAGAVSSADREAAERAADATRLELAAAPPSPKNDPEREKATASSSGRENAPAQEDAVAN